MVIRARMTSRRSYTFRFGPCYAGDSLLLLVEGQWIFEKVKRLLSAG
jgi:hypothetical protein